MGKQSGQFWNLHFTFELQWFRNWVFNWRLKMLREEMFFKSGFKSFQVLGKLCLGRFEVNSVLGLYLRKLFACRPWRNVFFWNISVNDGGNLSYL